MTVSKILPVFPLLFFALVALAQDEPSMLNRPGWQANADLDFQLACQKAKDKLCREFVRSIADNPATETKQLLLDELAKLLELAGDGLPSYLPVHDASSKYVEDRKAAVIAWLKMYRKNGKELPKTALDRERAFAAEQTKRLTNAHDEVEEKPNAPATKLIGGQPDLKSKIVEIDKLLKDSRREVAATKTTADRQDALIKHAEIVHDWAETQTELQPDWDFEVVVNDVAKVGDGYFARTGTAKLLESFLNQGTGLMISDRHSFTLTDEQRKIITIGSKLLVRCKIQISIGKCEESTVIGGRRVLFRLCVDDGVLGSYQGGVTKGFAVVFCMDETEISVADVKKGPQTKPSKPKR